MEALGPLFIIFTLVFMIFTGVGLIMMGVYVASCGKILGSALFFVCGALILNMLLHPTLDVCGTEARSGGPYEGDEAIK